MRRIWDLVKKSVSAWQDDYAPSLDGQRFLVKRPVEPSVKQKSWVRTSVDAYILAQLEAKGIKPSPDADRATFIRRATLDAWGVIPTPEEVRVFVDDRSPKRSRSCMTSSPCTAACPKKNPATAMTMTSNGATENIV